MFVCVGIAWKIFLVTARSLWSVLGGGGRESLVKHGVGGANTGGGGGRAGKDRAGAMGKKGSGGRGGWVGKDQAGEGEGHGRGRTGRGGARRVHYAPGSH
jgi:hypothetical protein